MNITDEMVLAACRAHAPQFDRMDKEIAKYAISQMRDALTAALSQCEQEPVGYQHRFRPVGADVWTEWREGKANFSSNYEYEDRALFTHPTDVRAQAIRECAEVASTFEDWGDYSGDLETASSQIKDRILSLLKEPS